MPLMRIGRTMRGCKVHYDFIVSLEKKSLTFVHLALIDQLQAKIKSYKKQIEEAEEIAALNLAKFRQAQGQLADASERADINEQALAKTKAKVRGASVGPLVS